MSRQFTLSAEVLTCIWILVFSEILAGCSSAQINLHAFFTKLRYEIQGILLGNRSLRDPDSCIISRLSSNTSCELVFSRMNKMRLQACSWLHNMLRLDFETFIPAEHPVSQQCCVNKGHKGGVYVSYCTAWQFHPFPTGLTKYTMDNTRQRISHNHESPRGQIKPGKAFTACNSFFYMFL